MVRCAPSDGGLILAKTWGICANGLHLHRKRPCRTLPKGKGTFYVYLGHFKFRIDFLYGRGMWARARTRRTDVLFDHPGVIWWEKPNMKKRIAKGVLAGDAKHLAPVETNRFSDLLSLIEHCAVRKYDDGDPREPGWITIKTQGAAWCVQVKDPDGAVSFTAVGGTLDQALETAALLLACDEAPWEPDRFLAAQQQQKKKK